MSSESDSDEDIFDRRNKTSRRDPPREVEDASDVDEDDEDLDAILQPGRYKVKATTQPTGKATAAKQMSREELMGEIYGKKTPRGRKRKADPVPAPKTPAKSKRTGDEPSAIEPDALDDEPSSATVGSVLKRSRPTATNAKGKEVLPVDTSIVLSDSDEEDLELEHLHYDDAPIMNLNSFSETSAYLPPAVVESLRLARESQAIASRLRQSDPLNDSPIRSTSTTSSSARPSSSPAAAVLLSLLCPLTSEVMKFRILKSQPFSLLLNEYIKKKKEPLNTYLRRHSMTEFLSDHKKLLEDGGFVVKFDGMPVQASQTPQDFGMLENETLQLALPPPPLSWVGDLEKEVGLRLSSRALPTPQPASVQLDDEEAEEEEEADADYVILRLRREGQEEKFRIDQDKQFQKLHDSYCQKKRLIPEKVKFIFDGLPLNMRSTPANEDMEDDDIVDVKVEPGAQLPAVAAATAAATAAAASASKPQPPRPAPVATYVEDDDDDSAYVLLRVRRGTEEDKFRIKRSDPFKKLQEAYCKKKGLKMAEARFVFDGLPLKGNQTAEGQDMEDEDIIDVEDN